jgi:hypothetical protein
MGAWSGPFLIATVLLAVGGVAKAIDPMMTAGALRAAGFSVSPTAVRLGGVAEAAVAIAAAITGAPVLAVAVGVSYVAFTGFVVVALARRLPIGTCGCFGRVDSPPSSIHVGVNLGAAASAFAVAAHDGGGLATTLEGQPLAGVPLLLLVGAGVYAAITALTVVPRLAQLGAENGRGR